MSAEAQLEAILEIINASARQAIEEYKKGGNDVPTIHSKTYHPIDFAIDSITLKKAVRSLEGACQQLCASLAPPQHTMFNSVTTFESTCVGVVVRAQVADALEKYPDGLHVDELAKVVNLEKGKLSRVLRLLATKGCFTEGMDFIPPTAHTSDVLKLFPASVEPNVFCNNRLSLVTVSSSDTGALLRVAEESVSHAAPVLYETMTEPGYATSYSPDMAPLMYAFKKKGLKSGYFDLLDGDEKRKTFHRAMIGINSVMGSLSVLHHYPWNEIKTFCDVGASFGTVSIPLSKLYPHLKIVNQDLPEVLAQAKDVWEKDAPEALQNNQVELVPLNFFEGSPVHGQDAYYLRHIIHNWPDNEAATIFRNVRGAMAPHSRLLIHEYALTPAVRDPNAKSFGIDVAPEPLLPNFGNGSNRRYQQDLKMWVGFNAKERMLEELIVLGSTAGLRLEKVYDLGEDVVLEFKLAL